MTPLTKIKKAHQKKALGSVYVLLLEDDHYYVGFTTNLKRRLFEHFHLPDRASAWTREHKPVKVLETLNNVSMYTEKLKTLQYMRAKGWKKVRGYTWCQRFLPEPPRELYS